ncbi:MAG TPA: DNA recombination protein RmuC, partial [Prevotella sp.]|nr:DNA recombination protein RmuC [Candidatus Segatella violae]
MEIVIGLIIGLAIGFFVGKLMMAKTAGEEKAQLIAKAQVLEKEKQSIRESQEAILQNERSHHLSEMQTLRETHEKQISDLKQQMANERQYAAKLREESDAQWAQKLEGLRQEMQRMNIEQQKAAAEQLAAKQSALQENNRLQMDELLKPIKEQFADFKKSVEESKTQSEVSKKELQSTFEATMRLFQQEQQQAVANLKEQTSKIGSDAANLTRAFKGDSKMQG